MSAGWTFQRLIDERIALRTYCQNSACNHHHELDLETLRKRFGPDAPAMADDLKPKLHCSLCGGKTVGLIYAPQSNAKGNPVKVCHSAP